MDLREVLFLGGDRGNMAAVQVRGRDIAQRLGCDFANGGKFVAEIPDRYAAFVCVKPAFRRAELKRRPNAPFNHPNGIPSPNLRKMDKSH
jgi:hypothetical protein